MRPTTSKESLNLTLVGETASGKTTLLNSLANYSQYPTLDEAIGNGPIVLADVGFAYNVPAGNRASVYVKGSVQNGGEQINGSGVTRTENCSFYTINIDESSNVKLYDSPGFGSQSPNQVDWARRPTHALCVVLKADETRLNPEFRSFLEKEGKAFSKNIVYCFTYCRVHNYLPSAATLALLRKFLLDLEGLLGVEFPTRKENIFCFENDCFRYLCYLSKSSGDKGRHHEKLSIEWKRNVKEYERLISSVNSLNPVLEEEHSGMNSAPNLLKTTKGKAASDSQTLAFSMSVLEEIPATHQATVPAVLQNVDLPLETKLEMLRAMKLEESVISKAADHLRPDFRLLLTESRRQTVNFLLKEEDWSVLKTVISVESTEIQAAYTAFLEKVAANGGRVPADPSEPAEGSSSSSNRPKEAQNSDQKNQENEAKAEKKSRFFDGFPEEMNILLLGEDGSGKVEFINSFANYLKYENFDEALKNGPEVVIPTDSISLVQDLNSAEMTYIPAEAETVPRETQKTQASKMYSFMADGAQKILRFIDTPDLIQDYPYWNTEKDKHLTNVLELVKNFGPIHAILIFVKSDIDHVWYHGTYLADAYKKLHHQASKNIIFCSTSIAKTSYRPGGSAVIRFAGWPYHFIAEHEVRPAKNNTYCFEIDSYSLLYAQKVGVPLSENAISLCRNHWTLSAQETFRLLGHIKTLTPFSNSTVYTISKLRPVLSDFFASRIVQIVITDEEIQQLKKGYVQQDGNTEADLRTLKERDDKFKRSLPTLVDFCVKLETCFQQNVLAYNDFFDYLRGSPWKKVWIAEDSLDPSTQTMFRTYFEREMEHYKKEKETYMNHLQETGSQITLEEIIAKELPAIEPYFAEESKEWKRILTEQQILSRPRSAKLITIKNDWYCNSQS